MTAPQGWDREIPRYRASRDIEPAEKLRFRFETPFSQMADGDVWQYGHRPIERGEIIETPNWPHESFVALNYSAARVLEFFKIGPPKSRLPWRPWRGDRIELDDGCGPAQPRITINSGVTAANE